MLLVQCFGGNAAKSSCSVCHVNTGGKATEAISYAVCLLRLQKV